MSPGFGLKGSGSMSKPATVGDNLSAHRHGWLKKTNVQKWIFVLLSITPAFGGYLVFTLYPNLLSVYYSFLHWDGIGEPTYVGFKNFVYMFEDPYVWRALGHNLLFMVTIPPAVILISLVLAYVLTNRKYWGSSVFKVFFFFPNVLSTVVIALLWSFIYDGSFGLLNAFLGLIGIEMGNFYWLGEKTALWAIIPPAIWGGVGFYIVIFVNAMVTIPKSLYESALLEGAGHRTRLFTITLPLISPIIRVATLFLALGVIKGFENVLTLTNGGPAGGTDVIGLYMFNIAFGKGSHDYGYASAIGMLLFVILITSKWLSDKWLPNQSIEY
ncbi:raffinose/stachyose/melibiose transport system permease protein/N-acetylglucosamine transport system permease protein [Cohnella phaseoli]|uniref:Raffinose/stachyose/melibiose transport system permease protein/N-acetylglucosamine transport system permease protein n=2 Tax=Cohnella phaseoli TaxID=456490 RepID=A0A3D9IHC6_9BACL|nr:raffinose/stachyose/melibiose transport system permease protein/N-acetylglucosamine transport system permease protein [Cohnella phaseoli]